MRDSIETIQLRDQMCLFNDLVTKCFDECVNSFRSKTLTESEKKCIGNCTNKFVAFQLRTATRFSEFQAKFQADQQKGF